MNYVIKNDLAAIEKLGKNSYNIYYVEPNGKSRFYKSAYTLKSAKEKMNEIIKKLENKE